jgi:hypothetical protein
MPERFHELILFADKNFEGAHKHVFRSQPYLGDAFNDLTSSFIVLSGAWKFYKDKDLATAQEASSLRASEATIGSSTTTSPTTPSRPWRSSTTTRGPSPTSSRFQRPASAAATATLSAT